MKAEGGGRGQPCAEPAGDVRDRARRGEQQAEPIEGVRSPRVDADRKHAGQQETGAAEDQGPRRGLRPPPPCPGREQPPWRLVETQEEQRVRGASSLEGAV